MPTSNMMREQVLATPAALSAHFDALELNARLAVETPDIYRTRQIILTGSGDSWFAAKAAESCFWTDAAMAAEVRTPLETGRYQSQAYPRRGLPSSLLIALSNSGGAARVAEAVTLWRQAGARVLAVTRNAQGRLAGLADRTLLLPIPELPSGPGFGPYAFALLGLELLAIRFGEVTMAQTMDEAQAKRAQLKAAITALEATIAAVDGPAATLAASIGAKPVIEFLGAGPSFAVAEYGAAKMLEATGRHAYARDLEEWAHLNYFDRAPQEIASVVVAPEGSVAESRAREIIQYMHKLGRSLVIVGGGTVAAEAKALGHAVLPVPAISERWSPLLCSAPLALLAAHLCAADDEDYGRGGKAPWDDSKTAATVQQSALWEPTT